jgi:sterol desaturase/sphingolipid hydroxylase (fatty acid hydroxylase superfamily)
MNLGIFVFLFALNAHHVHHGYLPHHRDKNLGLVTSVWDRLIGTLYIGEPYEQTPWGLGPDEQAHYTTFIQNVVGPFQEVYALLTRRETASSNT